MNRSAARHLSDDEILLFTTGETSFSGSAEKRSHLERCPACHQRLAEASAFRLDLKNALEFEDHTAIHRSKPVASIPATPISRTPKRIAIASVATAALVFLAVWVFHPNRLEAKEVLSRAVQAEARHSSAGRYFLLRSGGVTCTYPLLAASTGCANLRQSLIAASWDGNDPFSASAFEHWLERAAAKTDRVLQSGQFVTVESRTNQGLISLAELTVSASDYKIWRTRLEFASRETIEMSVVPAPGSAGIKATQDLDAPLAPAPNPADISEIEGWVALDRFGLLDGWRATLRRNRNRLEAIAAADPSTRDELAGVLGQLGIGTAMVVPYGSPEFPSQAFAPSREPFTGVPPSGKFWLRQTLQSADQVNQTTNEVLRASQRVLGLARLHEILTARQSALRNSPSISKLAPVVRKEENSLREATRLLVVQLGPLFEPSGVPPPLLRSAQAVRLDAALIHLMASGRPGPSAFADDIREIEELLRVKALQPGDGSQ